MGDVFVGPSELTGKVTPPPSKSIAHRALILAALAQGDAAGMAAVRIQQPSQDIQATIDCLRALLAPGEGPSQLYCSESGSTLRFLVPVAAALGKEAVFTGAGRLSQRPLQEYCDILKDSGITLDSVRPGHSLPLKVQGKLRSGRYYVPGHISSQYITGLLLALPLLAGESTLQLTSPLQSAPYVDITLSLLAQFGVETVTLHSSSGGVTGWHVPGNQQYTIPQTGVDIEADYSQAAFWLVAQFMGQPLVVCGLNPDSLQGDRAIIPFLVQLSAAKGTEAVTMDVGHTPDLAPALAVAACFTPGHTVITNAGRLRFKESDRLQAIAQGLSAIGADIRTQGDCLIIAGGKPLVGGEASSHNDHRIAMALAIAALGTQRGVRILGASAIAKSYPNFYKELIRLGGNVHDLNLG